MLILKERLRRIKVHRRCFEKTISQKRKKQKANRVWNGLPVSSVLPQGTGAMNSSTVSILFHGVVFLVG